MTSTILSKWCSGMAIRRKGEQFAWSHPVIYFATIEVGQHDMLNCTYSVMRARWEKALDKQLAQGGWGEIPRAAAALPAPSKTDASNAEAKAAMNRIGAGGIMNKLGRDHKAWAKKILDNPKGRSPVVLTMTRAAMDGVAA